MQASSDGCAPRDAMVKLHQAFASQVVERDNPAYASIQRRLDLVYGAPRMEAGSLITEDLRGGVRLNTTPAINRTPMAPEVWPPNPAFRLLRLLKSRMLQHRGRIRQRRSQGDIRPDTPDPRYSWHRIGTFRRIMLLGLVLAQTTVATYYLTGVLPYHGGQPLEIAILSLFAILFGWISTGFWTAMMGFLVLLGGGRYAISRTAPGDASIHEQTRTALVMPICNENVSRVFAGLRATYESLARTGEQRHFDFFVLSDSSDPDLRVAETQAWVQMRHEIGESVGVFYRWRQHRIKRKSGNLADFCRRWGKNYRYMIVLDADSVMSGECLTRLVRLMEVNPNAGIIQTAPRAAGRDTLFARIQQFATRAYGPLYTAGLHFWQLGESYYWGHNAIIRIAPFIRHCALGRLPGHGALSGEILSHDFVEAALMRRAGWAVWIAYDLAGSYEEMPPNLVDELRRDRRWCQGNLINSRLLMAEGLHPAHRVVFMTGVMTYLSAPLWFLSLLLSTALLAVHTLVPPQYFVEPRQLFPLWPEWHPEWALRLLSATATLLFLPKILSVALIWAQGAKRFGGGFRLAFSMMAELFSSALLAPIRMLFHTQFVVAALTGLAIPWKSPPREDAETTWGEALRRHGLHTLLGLIWAGSVYWLNPSFLWWLLPVVGALILSVPISVYSSRVSLGRRLRTAGLFVIPEESWPPRVLQWTQKGLKRPTTPPNFVDAVVDPVINALICASGVARIRQSAAIRKHRLRLVDDALKGGPAALTGQQKMTLLGDPVALSHLHFQVWTSPAPHPVWLEARALTEPIAFSTGA
jgi:membrane glycosyltransferase